MTAIDRDLVGFALGFAEPGDALALHEGLLGDPDASLQVAGLATLEGLATPGPRVPAPTLGCAPAATLAPGQLPRPGDRAVLRVVAPLGADRVRLALFRSVAGQEQLLFPMPGRAWPTLAVFRAEGDERLVDVVLDGPPGDHRYTLVLLPADLYTQPWPAVDPRWRAVRQAAARGDLPASTTTLSVGGATS